MKRMFAVLLVPALAGCLTARVPEVAHWNVEADDVVPSSSAKAPFGVARLSQVVVCAPYDERTMTVYRDDNTLAEDPYNQFASVPSRLLREPAREILAASGKFKGVVGASSSANVSHVVELTITDFRLDCSTDEAHPDRREAVVEAFAVVLDGGRNIVATGIAASRADARDGNYGAAFSKAFTAALEKAASKL